MKPTRTDRIMDGAEIGDAFVAIHLLGDEQLGEEYVTQITGYDPEAGEPPEFVNGVWRTSDGYWRNSDGDAPGNGENCSRIIRRVTK